MEIYIYIYKPFSREREKERRKDSEKESTILKRDARVPSSSAVYSYISCDIINVNFWIKKKREKIHKAEHRKMLLQMFCKKI